MGEDEEEVYVMGGGGTSLWFFTIPVALPDLPPVANNEAPAMWPHVETIYPHYIILLSESSFVISRLYSIIINKINFFYLLR